MRGSQIIGWLSLSLLVMAAGCGKKDQWNRVSIHGRVTLDGVPIEQGTISFFPLNARGTAAGGEIRGGEYSIPARLGPVVGPNKVEIHSVRKTGRQVTPAMMPEGDFDPTQVQVVEEYLDIVPKQFNQETELNYELTPGDNQLDLELVSKPPSGAR